MIVIRPLQRENVKNIVGWSNTGNEDFLLQWSGRGYNYPLTEAQVISKLDNNIQIFEAIYDDKMIGTIEIIKLEDDGKTARIGRFLIDPSLTGKGYGTAIINSFKQYCLDILHINCLNLNVFSFNQAAYKCYEKVGFKPTGKVKIPNGWITISMSLTL